MADSRAPLTAFEACASFITVLLWRETGDLQALVASMAEWFFRHHISWAGLLVGVSPIARIETTTLNILRTKKAVL